MKIVQNFLFVYVYVFVFNVELSVSFIFEIAKLIPNFEFKPVVLYRVGNKTVIPTTPNIIEANGYPSETHVYESEDGYISEVHRIPYGIKSPPGPGKIPVILLHGNLQSSTDWVINSPTNHSLGFLLADSGYDVWMGNQRGNTYSNRHVKFPLTSHDYWNFSFHEIGKFDIPAIIDYVTKTTGQPKVHYISFSLGTTAFYAGLALRPEYNSKIGLGVTMGPSVFMDNFVNGAAKLIAFSSKISDGLFRAFGTFPALPHFLASLLHIVLPLVCNPKLDILGICINFTRLFFGDDGGVITKEQLPLITSVTPSPTGYKAMNHVIQLVGSRRFAEYDYGRDMNLEMYNRPTPPDYNLTNVRAPIAIFVGPNDFLAHRQDAKTLAKRLPNLVEFYSAPYKHFTHLDFTYGKDHALVVYLRVIELLKAFD